MSRDLGLVELLDAEAIGEPGQRRFRIFARAGTTSAIMWVEKDQLHSLSLALDRVLAQVSQGRILRTIAQVDPLPAPAGMPANFPKRPTYEFQVGQIRLGYDENRELLVMIAAPLELILERGQEPQVIIREEEAISLLFTPGQAQLLTRTISALMSSGRPVCPLCQAPLDGGPHACEKQNGHRQIIQVIEEEEDSEEEE